MDNFRCLKITMTIFNFIICLMGFAIQGVGIWMKVDLATILRILEKIEGLGDMGYLLITVGAVMVLLGFLGCCGAVKENTFMLMLYFVLIMIVFVVEVAGTVMVLLFRNIASKLLGNFGKAVVKSIKKNYGKKKDLSGLLDSTMGLFKCCGFYNMTDFEGSPYYLSNGNQYPRHCCSGAKKSCDEDAAKTVITKISGCFDKVLELIDSDTGLVVVVLLIIASVQMCAVVFSAILFCRIKRKNYSPLMEIEYDRQTR